MGLTKYCLIQVVHWNIMIWKLTIIRWIMMFGWLPWIIIITLVTFIPINIITIWKDKHFPTRLWRRLQCLSPSDGPHMLCSLLWILEEWAGWHPNEWLKTIVLAVPPVVQLAVRLFSLNLRWILPLKLIWNTFLHDPWSLVLHDGLPGDNLSLVSSKKA